MKKILSMVLTVAMLATMLSMNAFAYTYVNGDTGVILFEAEENNVKVNGAVPPVNSGYGKVSITTTTATQYSGLSFVQVPASAHTITWDFTPEYDGNYRFELTTTGQHSTNKSTFHVGNTLLYTGVINEDKVQNEGVAGLFTQELGNSIALKAGTTYELKITVNMDAITAFGMHKYDCFKIYRDTTVIDVPKTDILIDAVDEIDNFQTTEERTELKIVTDSGNYSQDKNAVALFPSEWAEYDVTVDKAGYYRVLFTIRVNESKVAVSVNGSKAEVIDKQLSVYNTNYLMPYIDGGLFYFNEGSDNTIKLQHTGTAGYVTIGTLRVVSPGISVVKPAGEDKCTAVVDLADWNTGITNLWDATSSFTKRDNQTWTADEYEDLTVIVAVYDGDVLDHAVIGTDIVDNKITVENIDVADGQTVKLFVWDAANLKPLTDLSEN